MEVYAVETMIFDHDEREIYTYLYSNLADAIKDFEYLLKDEIECHNTTEDHVEKRIFNDGTRWAEYWERGDYFFMKIDKLTIDKFKGVAK